MRSLDHYYLNLSNLYIASLVLLFGAALALGRTETFTGNKEFLKSMIPHHSRAILVCQTRSYEQTSGVGAGGGSVLA